MALNNNHTLTIADLLFIIVILSFKLEVYSGREINCQVHVQIFL